MSLLPFTTPFAAPSFYNPWAPSGFDTDFPVTPFETPYERQLTKSFDRDFGRMRHEMERAFRNLDRTFSSELSFMPSRPASMVEHYSLMNPIRVDSQGNRWLSVNFDLRAYKPEEVNVTLDTKNRTINVEANHEVKEKDHYVKRTYSRRVLIPDPNLDLSKVELKSCLTNEGLLCVEAALPRLSIEEAQKQPQAVTQHGHPNVYPINVKTV